MNQPWQADFEVTDALAKRLIETQFPQLGAVHLQPFGEGWDNKAFLINDRIVFRFPRREVAAPAIQYEMAILSKIAPHLPLPIPNPIYAGKPDFGYPWVFSGYDILDGDLACSARLNEAERHQLAAPLGEFLACLHQQAFRFDPANMPPDNLGRNDLVKVHERIEKHYPMTKGLLSPELRRAVRAYMDHPPSFQIQRDSLVHGDFYVRHLLLNASRHLAGVIDFGDCMLGDPGIDMAMAWTFLPPSAHAVFKQAYGPMRPDSWRFASCFSLIYGLILTNYGHAEKDEDLIFESQLMMKYWLEAHHRA